MGFASTYLENRALFNEFITEAPDKGTGIIVVVPAYDEPGVTRMLDSLAACIEPECHVEVLIVVNAPSNAPVESLRNNLLTIDNIRSWKKANSGCFFRLFEIIPESHSFDDWGVGLARKTGMDEAVRRFNLLDNPAGIILNLDADCEVEKNYLVSVYREFSRIKNRAACSIYFEHPLTGNEFQDSIYNNIVLYELHLRYYYQGLAYCGFPYVFHTVGSSIGVKALAYVKAGGMNRRQAGEDFYFIQKLVHSGGYFNLNTTTVYPSPRVSSRVPFGTGAAIGKMEDNNQPGLLTYNFRAFQELHSFFGVTDVVFSSGNDTSHDSYVQFPPGLKLFLNETEWRDKMQEIHANTSGLLSFRKRFFIWFNMFKIVKYLNFVHAELFEKLPVDIASIRLLENQEIKLPSTKPFDLLMYYRSIEKKR
jgi:hypothetical protein